MQTQKNLVYNFLTSVACLFLLSSCNDVIQVDLEDKSGQLVVDGAMYDGKDNGRCIIKLSRTMPYFDSSPAKIVSGAVVTLKNNTEGKQETLTENPVGTFQSKEIVAKIGNSYTLEVRADGEIYRATTQVLPVPEVDSLVYETKTITVRNNEQKTGVIIKYFGEELPEEKNFYRVKMYVNGQLMNKPEDLLPFSDVLSRGKYISNVELNGNTRPLAINDIVRVEILSLPEDVYYFYADLQKQSNNALIFTPPLANISTNIVNINPNSTKKAVGIFVAAGLRAKEGKIEQKEGVIK